MNRLRGRSVLRDLLVGLTAGVIVVAAPAAARTVIDYARNAGKVDGFSAVSHRADDRAGKLVATDSRGRLPNGIIRKARAARRADDAARLAGLSGSRYARRCSDGALLGTAYVPSDAGPTYQQVRGFGTIFGGFPTGTGEPGYCETTPARARRVEAGVYRVDLGSAGLCSDTVTPEVGAVVTPVSTTGEPLAATYAPACEAADDGSVREVVIEVRIADLRGRPVDAPFTVVLTEGNPTVP